MTIHDKFMLPATSGLVYNLMGRNEYPVAFIDGNKKPKPNTAFKRYEYPVVEVENKFVKLELLALGAEAVGWKATDVNNVEALLVLHHGESQMLLKSAQTVGGVFQGEFWLQWVNSAFRVVLDEATLERCKTWTTLKKGNHLPAVGSVVRLITGHRLVYLGEMQKLSDKTPTLVFRYLREDSLDNCSSRDFTDWGNIHQSVKEVEAEFCAETSQYQAQYRSSYAYLYKGLKIYSLSKDEYTLRAYRDSQKWDLSRAVLVSFNAHDTPNEVKITCLPEVIRSFNSDKETISTIQVTTQEDDNGNLLWDQPSFVETATSYKEMVGAELSEILEPLKVQFQLLEKLNHPRGQQYNYTIEHHPKYGEVRCVEFGAIKGAGHIRCLIQRDNTVEVYAEHHPKVEPLKWLKDCLYKEVLMALRDRNLVKVWSPSHPDLKEVIAMDHPDNIAYLQRFL